MTSLGQIGKARKGIVQNARVDRGFGVQGPLNGGPSLPSSPNQGKAVGKPEGDGASLAQILPRIGSRAQLLSKIAPLVQNPFNSFSKPVTQTLPSTSDLVLGTYSPGPFYSAGN